MQAAVDLFAAALRAEDWVAECAEPVLVDATPERAFGAIDLEERCIIHVSGGGTSYGVLQRAAYLIPKPQVVIGILRYLAPDEAGQVDAVLLARVEAVVDHVLATVVAALVGQSQFALSGTDPISRPERYQADLMKSGTFLTAVIVNLQRGGGA